MNQNCDIIITVQPNAETIIDTRDLVVGKRIRIDLLFVIEFQELQKDGVFWPYIFFMRTLDGVRMYAEYEISIDSNARKLLEA